MDYLHIKNLEKYHPTYKDRNLIWCKTYFSMINADPEFEMLEEIDKWRFMAFIMLEIQSKKPIPLDERYLTRKGFNFKKRAISLTLKMLHNFIMLYTEDEKVRGVDIDKEVEEEIEKRKKFVTETFDYFLLKTKQKLQLTSERKAIIEKRYKNGKTIEELKKAIDNFIQDDWEDRSKFMDLIYCLGVRNKIDNFEKWLNMLEKKPKAMHWGRAEDFIQKQAKTKEQIEKEGLIPKEKLQNLIKKIGKKS